MKRKTTSKQRRSDSVNMRPEEFTLLPCGPKKNVAEKLPDPLQKLRELRERHNLGVQEKK